MAAGCFRHRLWNLRFEFGCSNPAEALLPVPRGKALDPLRVPGWVLGLENGVENISNLQLQNSTSESRFWVFFLSRFGKNTFGSKTSPGVKKQSSSFVSVHTLCCRNVHMVEFQAPRKGFIPCGTCSIWTPKI